MTDPDDPFPPIETDSLRLRCVRQGDAPATSRLMTAAVSQWLASWPVPFTMSMSVERIARAREASFGRRAAPFVAERRTDGAFLGWISVNRAADDPTRGIFAYWLGEVFHGRGYMREAGPAVLAAAFDYLDIDVIEAAAKPENAASFAVMRRCGMVPAGDRMVFAVSRNRHEFCLVYEIKRP